MFEWKKEKLMLRRPYPQSPIYLTTTNFILTASGKLTSVTVDILITNYYLTNANQRLNFINKKYLV